MSPSESVNQPSPSPSSAQPGTQLRSTQRARVTLVRAAGILGALTVCAIAILVMALLGIDTHDANPPDQLIPSPPQHRLVVPSVTPSGTITAQLPRPDLPLLYPSVQWQATQSSNVEFYIHDGNDVQPRWNVDGVENDSATLSAYPYNLAAYYVDALGQEGWKQTGIAQGPMGETFNYQKGSFLFKVIILAQPQSWDEHLSGVPFKYKAIVAHN